MNGSSKSSDPRVPQLPAGVSQDKYNEEIQAAIKLVKRLTAEDLKNADLEKLIGVCASQSKDPT
jgi:hypothetical protein